MLLIRVMFYGIKYKIKVVLIAVVHVNKKGKAMLSLLIFVKAFYSAFLASPSEEKNTLEKSLYSISF